MPVNSWVTALGWTLELDRQPGYFRLDTWTKLCDVPAMQRETYRGLTYTEAMDVILSHADRYRPGTALTGRHTEPPLPFA